MMQLLKHVVTKQHQPKPLFSSFLTLPNNTNTYTSLSPCPSPPPLPSSIGITRNDVANAFKAWFVNSHRSRDPLLHRIYQILSSGDDFACSLSSLSLPLSEPFVIKVLRYGASVDSDVLSCLRFFDWAGRQPHFNHTRATFVTIFRILSRAKLKPLVFDFLSSFSKRVFAHRVRFNDTLVIGYAIAGKLEIALCVFGKMRFRGLDLDHYAYHVLLNALADNINYINAFDVMVNQIRLRGYECPSTSVITIKSLCKRGRLEEAEAYLNELVSSGKELYGSEVSYLVAALCESKRFERAVELVREFGNNGLVPLDNAYGVWIRGLVRGGKLDEALEFFRQKKDSEGYVPSTVRYNLLICRLLREHKLRQAYDLLMDMNETCTFPDMVTINAVLCFFCKVGMVDVALELYNSRSEFGLSPNYMAYKYLILTLCWDGSVDEAYRVLRNSVGQGYFPDRPTFSTLANALCRECKIDEMKELLHLALQQEFMPHTSTYDRFISALCRAGRVEDGYLIHGGLNNVTVEKSFSKMIRGFVKSYRGDIAARLLVEMKDKGHKLSRSLCRAVICCLLDMDNSIGRVFNLLEMLTYPQGDCEIYNCFIYGAFHAKKPELAWHMFELMKRSGVQPSFNSQTLMLGSFLKSGRISDALNFFNSLQCQGVVSGKLYSTLINGLCKSDKVDIALDFLFQMLRLGLGPSIECYETLVQKLCSLKRYHEAISLVNLYEEKGRPLTSFIGNVLLFHSLVSPELYDTCVHLRGVKEGEFSGSSLLSLIIGTFSGRLRVNHSIEDLEELIAKCFPLDIYTYNMFMKKVTSIDMDQACVLFDRICQKGYEPNKWTYDIMVHGFSNHGRKDEAKRWVEEMHRKGFYPTKNTMIFI